MFVTNCLSTSSSKEMWLVDSVCSNHMTNNLELFTMLEEVKGIKVKIGNRDYINVKGKGTITLETFSSTKMTLYVLFIPKIDQNLLSVIQLLEKGFKLLFEDNMWLTKDAEVQ